MKLKPLILLLVLVISSCHNAQAPMKVNSNASALLNEFIKQPKFNPNYTKFFPGLSNPKLESELNSIMNAVAKDFLTTSANHPTEEKFQQNIKTGLSRFNALYLELDTEDREQVCRYFEEIMDCVGLENSDGQLNEWMYGFDPKEQ